MRIENSYLTITKRYKGNILEEKLYFKPGNYGKGKKKKQAEQEVDNSPEKKDHKALKLISLLLFLLIIVIVIIWFLRGKTTTSGRYPENIKKEALICESDSLDYSKITSVTSDKKNIKINLIFGNDGALDSISLIYTMYFNDESAVRTAEAKAHAEFNLGLNSIGLPHDEFDNKFARYSDRLIVSLFGNRTDIDEYKSSYFMLNDIRSEADIPKTIDDFLNKYTASGIECKRQNNNPKEEE